MVEGNSCDSTKDQLEAVSPQRVPHLLGVYVSAPLQETEGEGGRQAGGQRGKWWRVTLPLCELETCWKMQLYCNRAGKSPQTGAVGGGDWVGR